jgi:hypothetical protein
MIDLTTQEPIIVHAEGTGGPYIMVPINQLEATETVLRNNGVSYWTDTDAISLDGKPAIVVINLGRGADAVRVQQILDAAN